MAKKTTSYDEFILTHLKRKIFIVSTELTSLLIDKFGISNDNARQIINRACKNDVIKSSTPFTFGVGRFAYTLPDNYFSYDVIKELCRTLRPPIFRLLEAIDLNDGIISYYEALKITSSPLKKSSSKVDHLDDLIRIIEEKNFIYFRTDENSVKYIVSSKKTAEESKALMKYQFSKMTLDTVFLKDILDWFSKNNLLSGINIIYRNKNTPSLGAEHNNLLWDAFGYTKTTGINSSTSSKSLTADKQTLVVFDVLINRDYNQIDLDGFFDRIHININSVKTNKRKVVPIIVYKNCPEYLLNKIKKLGFLSFDIASIYGSNIFRIIENISKIQLVNYTIESKDFNLTIEETLKTIKNSGQEDKLKELKGTLFEVMMYQILKHQFPNSDIQSNVFYSKDIISEVSNSKTKEKYEYDYIIKSSNPKEIIIVELKGYHADHKIPLGDNSTKQTINWFYRKTLPFIKDKFKKDIEEGYKFKGIYITTSQIEEEALNALHTIHYQSFKPQKVDLFFDRTKLLQYIEQNDFSSLGKIIHKFY